MKTLAVIVGLALGFTLGFTSKANASTRSAAQGCCKICHHGKACGDSCIRQSDVCHRPPGCACDG
jgi:hypothetical protein